MQPLYNRRLRKTDKLLLAKRSIDDSGYLRVSLEEAHGIDPMQIHDTLAIYARRSQARDSLNEIQKLHDLCPKLLGLEKSKGSCFLYQLHKCRGACGGHEPSELYNRRVEMAFERQRIRDWPYKGPILLQEVHTADELSDQKRSGVIIDQWCVIAEVSQQENCEPVVQARSKTFDLDTYKILRQFIETKLHKLKIQPLNQTQIAQFGMS